MKIHPLVLVCFRTSRAHPLRTLLMIFGIALGVAGVIAIDLAKTSVEKSFELSAAALTVRSTHQITGPDFTLPQSVFVRLRTQAGIAASAPVIAREVRIKEAEGRMMTLMGIDPFSEALFREIRFDALDTAGTGRIREAMTRGAGLVIPRSLAHAHGLSQGDRLTLVFGENQVISSVSAVMADTNGSSPLQGVVLADISLAQEILGMGDRISRIDLILEDASEAGAIRSLLDPGLVLVETHQRNNAIRDLSRSFETSLTAFSMLVLFMGIFLIYNTVSFSVARRHRLNGTLRALGATPSNIFWAQEAEVLFYAVLGSGLGVGLGILMGQGTVQAVCATVSDMYYTLTVSQTHITAASLVKGVLTGLGAALVSSLVPALNAARTLPVTLMQRSASESGLARHIPWLTLAGLPALGLALTVFFRSGSSMNLVFTGIFLVFIGSSLLAPALVSGLIRAGQAGLERIHFPGKTMARIGLGNVRRSLSRTAVLIASLMVVISVYIGIDTMTRSFRLSIIDWVNGHIGGDVHVSSPDELDPALDRDFLARIESLDRVAAVSDYNIHRILSQAAGEVHVFSYVRDLSHKQWTWTVNPDVDKGASAMLDQGWILVSEIFARHHKVVPGPGAAVMLDTRQGPVSFRVAGIFRDFFMGGGRIIVSRKAMAEYWGKDEITAVQMFVEPKKGEDKAAAVAYTMAQIEALAREQDLDRYRELIRVRSGAQIKSRILAVFDKTFLITSALQVLTALVALTGIINSVMALILERSRELGILRACGAMPAQIRSLVLWECGISGCLAGVLAIPLGVFLSWVLVDVVNFRSFGWTYDMVISPLTLVQSLGFACLAALGAGLIPAVRAGRIGVARALRME